MRYQYAGPGPVTDPDSGEIVRPGDVREYDAEPPWGPWELLDGPDTPAADPEPAPAGPPAERAADAPAPSFTVPATPKDM